MTFYPKSASRAVIVIDKRSGCSQRCHIKQNITLFHATAVFLITLVLAGGAGCTSEKGKRYYCAAEKFSISFPKAWMVREGVKGTVFLAELPAEGELSFIKQNLNVLVEETKAPVSLGNYVDLQVGILNRLKGIKTFSRSSTVINGIPVLWFFYSYTIQDFGYKAVVYSLTRNNKKFYIITGIAEFNKFNNYETLFSEAAHSFRFE